MKRGEVWWAYLPQPVGRRPVVLLSRDSSYKVRSAVTIAPVTRTIRNIPVEVPLDQSDGLFAPCVINLDDITTIPKSTIRERISVLSPDRVQQIEEAICFALDLSER